MPKTVKKPYLHFYPSDHDTDPGVMELHPISEFVWLKMLLIASECEERGRLAVKGKPISVATIAHRCRMPINQVKDCIKQILEKGVGSKGSDGVIFSRRMVRDEQYRKKQSKYGTQGLKKSLAVPAAPAAKSAKSRGTKSHGGTKGIEWNGASYLPSQLESILRAKQAELAKLKKPASGLGSHNIRPLSLAQKKQISLLKGQVQDLHLKLYGSPLLDPPPVRDTKPAVASGDVTIVDLKDSELKKRFKEAADTVENILNPPDQFRGSYYKGADLKSEWEEKLERWTEKLQEYQGEINRRGLATKKEAVTA